MTTSSGRIQRAEALAGEVGRTFVEAGLAVVQTPEISPRKWARSFGSFQSVARWRPSP